MEEIEVTCGVGVTSAENTRVDKSSASVDVVCLSNMLVADADVSDSVLISKASVAECDVLFSMTRGVDNWIGLSATTVVSATRVDGAGASVVGSAATVTAVSDEA